MIASLGKTENKKSGREVLGYFRPPGGPSLGLGTVKRRFGTKSGSREKGRDFQGRRPDEIRTSHAWGCRRAAATPG
eukprot:9496633-Pyramimonas_sp.AAC.1